MTCQFCRDIGWILDHKPGPEPLLLELIACPIPDCAASGRPIEHLSFKPSNFTRTVFYEGGLVMAVGR